MLQVKKIIKIGLFLGAFTYIAVAHQVVAITITTPVSATDPLIAPAVGTVVGSASVVAMRNNVRNSVMGTQSAIDTSPEAIENLTQLPMQSIMVPLMQDVIMVEIMGSLSDVTNADGLVPIFAPDIFTP